MADALAWVGAVSGVVGGGAGLTFGLVAFFQARTSNKLAQDARDLAQRGEQLGAEANDLARESNRVAVDARELAEEANTISRRGEARETELHDVRWVGHWEQPGRYVLTNKGEHEALRVNATVTVDGEEAHLRADSVPGKQSLVFDLPRARDQLLRERRELAAYNRRAARGEVGDFPLHLPNAIFERVVWVTPLGKERIHDVKSPISDLGE